MLKKCIDVKLNVQPICFGLVHRCAYEGPCRFASGEALTPEFDAIGSQEVFQVFKEACSKNMPEFVHVREPLYFEYHDDWILPDKNYDEMMKDLGEIDVYLVSTGIAREIPVIELAERSKKPILLDPNLGCEITALTAAILCRGLETYAELDWKGIATRMKVLWTRKAIQKTNVLVGVRFNSNTSQACNDSLNSLPDVTNILGTHFRYMNIHEFFDYMEPLSEAGNYTTPGRKDTPNITKEEIKEAEKMADELIAGANEVHVERKHLVKSCMAHVLVKKLLELYNCSAFSFPCPDACSTTRIDKMQFTLCLNHSLLTEQGIPSTCDSDVNSLMSMLMMTMMTGKAPYLGNARPLLVQEDGTIAPSTRFSPEEDLDADDDRTNLYVTDHSTMIRKLHGINGKCSDYSLRHFAFDKQFGGVLRYRFADDKGQVITMCKLSPDCKKMFIGKGTIVSGGGYDKNNCNGYVIYRVENQKKFYQAHAYVGNHLPLVYGDCVEEMRMLAEALGLEPLVV